MGTLRDRWRRWSLLERAALVVGVLIILAMFAVTAAGYDADYWRDRFGV